MTVVTKGYRRGYKRGVVQTTPRCMLMTGNKNNLYATISEKEHGGQVFVSLRRGNKSLEEFRSASLWHGVSAVIDLMIKYGATRIINMWK